MNEIGAVVLLADNFGDLILPDTALGTCSRTRPLEEGFDYLATPLYMLHGDERHRRRPQDHSKGCLRVNDHTWWHSFDPHVTSIPCTCADGQLCRTKSRLGKAAKENGDTSSDTLTPLNIFDAFPDGAAIIGGPNKLPPALPSSQDRLKPDSEPSPQTDTAGSKWQKIKGRTAAFLKRKI